MANADERITVYADYVCPFCYLGRQSLESYRETRADGLAVEWHPFDLRGQKRGPDGELGDGVDDGKDAEYYEQARQNVLRLQEEYGADEMRDPDDVPDGVDSFDAQVASAFVQREYPNQWDAFDAAVYEAHWVDGRDVGDADVLAELAEDVGLDGAAIRSAVADEAGRERLAERFSAARRHGVTGVPTFVVEGRVARGAVPPERLARLVEGE